MYLVAFCLTLAACGGDDGDDTRPQPTTTSPSTTQSQEDEDEQALRQLAEDWFEAVRQAYMEEEVALESFATDPYLSAVQDQIATFRASGNEAQSGEQTRHEMVSVVVNGDSAVLVECVIDADRVLAPDGEVINDEVQANLYETEAERSGEGWRLIGRRTLQEVDGSTECPAL